MKRITKKILVIILSMLFLLIAFGPFCAYADDSEYTQEELEYITENPVVITAVDPSFLPYEFIDSDGIYKGMAADYLKLIEVKTGLTFKILEGLTWPEAYDLALNGQIDLLPCVGITKEREDLFLFTDGYFKYQRAIFTHEDDKFQTFKNLKNVTVGVQRNSSHYSFLTYETDIEPLLYDDTQSLLQALSKGEVDAAVANYASAKYIAGQLGITNIKADEILDSETSELGMAIKKDKVILASILNKALAKISEEEKILIRNKWLGIETEADYSTIYRYIFISIPIIIGVLLLLFFWNRTLKKQQAETNKALDKVENLYKASLAIRSTINLIDVLKIILSELKEVVSFDTASIQEYDNGTFEIIYCEGFKNPESIIGERFTAKQGTINQNVLDTKASVVIADVRDHNDFTDLSKGKKIRSFMAVPLIINDIVIGELTLDSYELAYYNDEKAMTAEAFASQAAIALNNAKNFKELEKAKAVAEHAAKAKGDFLANMSHEIRTPMNAILGMLTLMEYTELEKKQKDYVRKIESAAKNLLTIINDILDFSKIEAGKLTIENVDFFLDDVLSDLSDVLSIKAGSKGIEFIISKEDKVPVGLVGDPLRLEQILLNLTNNAIKFTENGEVIIDIGIENLTKEESLIKFNVKDTGIGMTEKQLSKLFSAFVQADTSTTRKYGGTGLGLSISKDLVELMGGSIGAKSEYGKGSEFYFTCPFKLSSITKTKKEIIPIELKELEVLVVEDNAYSREVMEKYLLSFGFDPILVSSGEEAVAEAINNTFDLYIIDYKMPGINGVETWKKIKNDAKNSPNAILVSSYGRQELINEASKEGFKDILTKPLTKSTLYDAIATILVGENTVDKDSTLNRNYPDGFDKIKGASILIVEDNEINQQVAKELLEIEGFWVDIAENGQEAIDKIIKSNPYDLVFMDLQMPIMDGYTATKKLRNIHNVTTPIIALSADAMEGTGTDASNVGMDDYIAKPIDKQQLFEIMVKYIKPKERIVKLDKKIEESLVSGDTLRETLSDIDVSDGLDRLGNNIELYINILKKFAKNQSKFTSDLKELINQSNIDESLKLLHKMKGVSGNIGAKNLNKMIKDMEHELKTTDSSKLEYNQEIEEIDIQLKTIINQINELIVIAKKNEDDKNEYLDKEEIIDKLKDLLTALKEYDTRAKKYYEELIKINLDSLQKKYNEMGEQIEEYDFESAAKNCSEMISILKESGGA